MEPDQERGRRGTDRGVVAEGIEAAKPFIKALCDAQAQLAAQSAKETQEFPLFPDYQDDAFAAVEAAVSAPTRDALTIADKQEREDRLDEIKAGLQEQLAGSVRGPREGAVGCVPLAAEEARPPACADRRASASTAVASRDIRTLSAEVEVLPRVHGSAMFERGETQILGVTTLNMLRMEQQIDTLGPETRKRYMHNYNFPPYSTGETGRVG